MKEENRRWGLHTETRFLIRRGLIQASDSRIKSNSKNFALVAALNKINS